MPPEIKIWGVALKTTAKQGVSDTPPPKSRGRLCTPVWGYGLTGQILAKFSPHFS